MAKLVGNSRLSLEEQTVFTLVSRVACDLMMRPAFLDYVRAEVERERKLQKALRLARAEREASDKKGKKKE